MGRIIALALEYRFFVFFVTGLTIVAGVVALQQLPIDAVPDITPVDAFSVRPAGSWPTRTAHAYGAIPPAIESVCE